MGEITGIAWTDSTINVWHGCDKVSAGCKYCYAEVSTPVRVKRAAGLEVWGANAARSETKGWEASLRKWQAARARMIAHPHVGPHVVPGRPWFVFGQSLSDTFEGRADLDRLRARFFTVIEACPALTFQLLTKRPENILRMVPPAWLTAWPAHVWIGATVEDQGNAEARIPHLLKVPTAMRFLSVEPQLGPVNLRVLRGPEFDTLDALTGDRSASLLRGGQHIGWVICGGESGSKARSFDLAWARSLRDQCKAAGVPLFLKQLGANPRATEVRDADIARNGLRDSHGSDENEWPTDLRGCRAFPEAHHA